MLISHDRDFLDRTVTATIAADGEGHWTVYAGGYTDMLAQRGGKIRGAGRGNGAAKPSRKPAKQAPEGGRETSKKLSYKQKYALETLPAAMEKLAAEIGTLEAKTCRSRPLHQGPAGLCPHRRPARRKARSACRAGRGMAGTGDAARRDRRIGALYAHEYARIMVSD